MTRRLQNILLAVIAALLVANLGAKFSVSQTVHAQAATQYVAVGVNQSSMHDATGVQSGLNSMAAQGWQYVGSVNSVMIFKK